MHDATHSVTQCLTSDETSFDLQDYMICKDYLALKDEQIARRCASIIVALPAAHSGALQILDVGTGEGSQTERICNDLANHLRKAFMSPPTVILDCVEPCPIAGQYLRNVRNRLLSLDCTVRVNPETIEEFVGKTVEKYALVLACHSLYHFPPSSWLSLLEKLMQMVNNDGLLLVNLVSRTSQIYRILDRLETEGRLAGIPRTFESCGHLCFSEDLAPVLRSLDCIVERQRISSTIVLPAPDVSKLCADLDLDAADASRIIQFFSFMFRVAPADLLAIGRDLFRELLRDGTRTLEFDSIDHMYLLRRRP